MAWVEVARQGRSWDEQRDTPRIRQAFVTLASTREQWPAPRHFLDALPRIETAAIGYEVKPATKEEADAAMATIRAMLGESTPTFRPKRKPTREGVPLSDVERSLQAHYGKDAAAGPDL